MAKFEKINNNIEREKCRDGVFFSRVGTKVLDVLRLGSDLSIDDKSVDEGYTAKSENNDPSVYKKYKEHGVEKIDKMTPGEFEYRGRHHKAAIYNAIIENEVRKALSGVRMTSGDERYLQNRKDAIESRDNALASSNRSVYDAEKEARFWDKSLESLLYVMADRGIFDSESQDGRYKYLAEPIWTSEYDDFANGIDCAFALPCQYTDDKTGKSQFRYVPIAIDCGSGSSDEVTKKLFDKGNKGQRGGDDELGPRLDVISRYAVDASGRVLANGNDKLLRLVHFTIGLDRNTMQEDILAGHTIDNLGDNVKTAIYAQLRDQANMKLAYLVPRIQALQIKSVQGALSSNERAEYAQYAELYGDIRAVYRHFNQQLKVLGEDESGQLKHDAILDKGGTPQAHLQRKVRQKIADYSRGGHRPSA